MEEDKINELYAERARIDHEISEKQAEIRSLVEQIKAVDERITKVRYKQQEEAEKC